MFNALQVGSNMTVIDVRTPEEFAESHLRSAINVPLDDVTGKTYVCAAVIVVCLARYAL